MKIIAELCQNHNGDFDVLKKMVDMAAEGGATHIKMQHIFAKNLTFRPEFEQSISIDGKLYSIYRPWKNEYERLKSLEISNENSFKFVEYVNSLNLTPLTTCFARCDIDDIYKQGFKEVKVASYDCSSYQLLRELSSKFEHIYISTGATFDDEIHNAVNTLRASSANFSLLHCVTLYPTPLDEMHLNRISFLSQYGVDVGFSDHSEVSIDGVIAAKAAIYFGAKLIERHFTIKDPTETKDGKVSITKNHLIELNQFSNLDKDHQLIELEKEYPNWKVMMGKEERWLSENEMLNRDYYRGRFASPRKKNVFTRSEMIFNWEETPL